MNEDIPVYVQLGGEEAEWKMSVEGEGPWRLRLESPDGVESTANGDNVFEALRSIRAELAPKGVTICCNGARVDVRPSGLSKSHGGWMVYILHMRLPSTTRDLVPTFGRCPARLVGSVEEQDAYWERHLKNRRNWINYINPAWWIYFFLGFWAKPRKRQW
ncbi:hypothetical protein [Streptomyces sp. WAC 01529]|uniref:hypothetical protein n=1 Tax=Streptomyces sp. WAC 01529 TaxID=2203205 RepID=UPI000F74AFA4|nr:hypothetical protein [Streptomyces sp. WAC 01529]